MTVPAPMPAAPDPSRADPGGPPGSGDDLPVPVLPAAVPLAAVRSLSPLFAPPAPSGKRWWVSDAVRYKQAGNSVCTPVVAVVQDHSARKAVGPDAAVPDRQITDERGQS